MKVQWITHKGVRVFIADFFNFHYSGADVRACQGCGEINLTAFNTIPETLDRIVKE